MKKNAEDTWESVEGVSHQWQLVQKYHSENPEKLIATSPSDHKNASLSLMTTCLEAKTVCYISSVTRSSPHKYSIIYKQIQLPAPTTSRLNQRIVI